MIYLHSIYSHDDDRERMNKLGAIGQSTQSKKPRIYFILNKKTHLKNTFIPNNKNRKINL